MSKDYITIRINRDFLFNLGLLIAVISLLSLMVYGIYSWSYEEGFGDGKIKGEEIIFDAVLNYECRGYDDELHFNGIKESRVMIYEDCEERGSVFWEAAEDWDSNPIFSSPNDLRFGE